MITTKKRPRLAPHGQATRTIAAKEAAGADCLIGESRIGESLGPGPGGRTFCQYNHQQQQQQQQEPLKQSQLEHDAHLPLLTINEQMMQQMPSKRATATEARTEATMQVKCRKVAVTCCKSVNALTAPIVVSEDLWSNTTAAANTTTATTTLSTPPIAISSGHAAKKSVTFRSSNLAAPRWPLSWTLAALSLMALFSCGHAGFACLSNPCVFGVCIDGLNSSYSCYCIDGYTGIQCQTNWDECWSGPCQNGGTCVDGVAYYNCTCPDGFTGSNCEENVDECMSNPCQNGGHCRDRNNGYTCTCQPGYLGVNCELDVAVCDTGTGARCQNGGECLEGPGLEFFCECNAGWQGRICQEEINECESSPCQNGGVCVDKLASYVCACPMGYTGANCEEEILICADNPCQNNALCLMEESVPTCYCVPDYHGEKCEYQYDECQLGPRCMNGGVCIDGVDTFSCSCPPLLTGMLCECYMIGEDSLDCNYTVTGTWSPQVTPKPTQPSPKIPVPTTESSLPSEVTVKSSTEVSKESGEPSISSETGEIGSGGDSPVTTTQKSPVPPLGGPGSESGSTEDDLARAEPTTQPPSTDAPGVADSSELYRVPESGSHSVSGEGPPEEVTPASESVETTTSPSLPDASSDTKSGSLPASGEPDSAVSVSSESDEQLPMGGGKSYTSTSSTIISHSVTTIETSFSFDYTSPRPSLHGLEPTDQSTDLSSGADSEGDDTSGSVGKGSAASPDDEYSDRDLYGVTPTTQRTVWSEAPTTAAAPFFTEYPEVYTATTRYHEFTSKDLNVAGPGGHFPPVATTSTPYYYVTTQGTYVDYEGGSATTAGPSPDIWQHHAHPGGDVTTPREHVPHSAVTTPHGLSESSSSEEVVTIGGPLHPDDMVTTTVSSVGGITTAEPEALSTTDRRPIITYVPPAQAATETSLAETTVQPLRTTAPPDSSVTAPPEHVTPPHQPAGGSVEASSAKPPHTSSGESSEEVDSSNTVAPGRGAGGSSVDTAENATDVDCLKHGCYNGGTCVTTSEGSRCVCRFDRQGPLCETSIVIKNAAFSGDSYVSHRIHKDAPKSHDALDSILPMHVQLKVRTRATNGLIMLAAAQGTKGGHYMALFLQKGLLQFQFSCGLQTMLLSELETPVNTGNEITIRAELDFSRNYTHCNASLLVNETLAMSGDQPTWLKLLPPRLHTPDVILNTWLHLGGAPQAPIGLIIELPPAQSGAGFTGCLHSLKINEQSREIFGEALDGFGITECGSLACLSSPCRNGAACIKIETNELDENGDKLEKWKCKCPTGYMGPTCEISVCEDNPCQYGGTCVQFPGSGYLCLCPLGKHGHYCEHNLEVALPSFSGSVNGLSSFVAYTVPIPLEYSIELSFKILPQTMSQISLLAFLGQTGYHDEKSDHLAISFIQGYIMLTWNLGGGPRRIFTQKPIDFRLDAPRVPYEVKVGRVGRQAWLSVDGKFNITGRSPGSVSRMDVMPILYLGGHENANFNTLPHDLPLHSGFQGCIYDVHLRAGQVTVPLQETRGVRGRGVGQCGTRECHRHACQHDGACLQHGATFTCICQEGWYGPLCAQPTNPCDSTNNKCSDDSTCVPLVNGYECDCPVGRTGKNCDEEIRSLSDVSLTGRRSYLAVRWPYLYDGNDKLGSKRSQMVSYRNFTKKLMPPKPISTPSQHFVMKLLNEVEKQRNFSPVPLMGSKSFEEQHRVQFFLIEFQLRPLSERGLLLYFGSLNSNQDRKIGFVSLSLQGGVVEFRISGPNNHVTVVRSVRMLAIGEWHKIKMAQRGRWLTLWVEGSASSALAPTAEVLVEPDSLLYIGGLKDLSKLPHNAISGFPIPFRGCVRGVVVSGSRIILNETNIVESRNIRDCDGTACGGDSCEAGGHCWLDEKLQPHCICPEYAKGDRCEYSETCKLIPCRNNGRCLRSGRCSCPNGWGGFYCEIAMSKPSTPSFRGNSYLILPPPRIPMKDKRKGPSLYVRPREAVQISMNFSTIEPNGLLLWSEHDPTRFLGLGLENGHLKIASNLLGTNNDTVLTPSTSYIADGGYHHTKVLVDRSRLQLQLDGEVIFTEKLADQTTMAKFAAAPSSQRDSRGRMPLSLRRVKEPSITYEDIFYLGGFPNMESVSGRTKGRFEEPFRGCLQDIQFGSEPQSVINDFSPYKGENIGSCDLHGDDTIIV